MSSIVKKLRLTRYERRCANEFAGEADPGRVGLESILVVAEWLSFIRSLRLPTTLISGTGAPTVERLHQRIRSTYWTY
ncbi:hypothetical protein [Mesorhizobium tianshanense]|uniref:Uncharacterized protein n=1 Tax=Mesorhizobium tianshanense TaxID=39844 RepID=A0A562MLH5_9HYPH|nr:hypothetical protein [Mesorhizobium tianshanense]TWI20775.1 hypothetical protein IQ26_06940 [Mesorhizobium tianshanense]